MDNDDQIIKDSRIQTQKATSLFMQDSVKSRSSPELYDLGKEFANTKKNKNIIIPIFLFLFTLISIIASFLVTKYIAYQNSQIPININAFEDVNLREIFDKAKQNDKNMQNALRDLSDLDINKNNKIEQLRFNADRAIAVLEEENSFNKSREITNIKTELESQIERDEELWVEEKGRIEERIVEIQNLIDSYDTRILEKAKEQEDIINNQQKLFDIEMDQTVNYYEAKLKNLAIANSKRIDDLTLSHNNIVQTIKYNNKLAINALEVKYNPNIEIDYSLMPEVLPAEGFSIKDITIDSSYITGESLTKSDIQTQIDNIIKTEDIIISLKQIPYYNFPKQAIEFLEYNNFSTVKNYKTLIKMVTNTKQTIVNQEKLINQLNYFLLSYVKTNRINGVVIDPRSDEINIYIDPIYNIKNGTLGLIYRTDSDFIGTLTFENIENRVVAHLEELVDINRPFEPFDMILIDLK